MADGAIIFWDLASVPPGSKLEFTVEWSRTINGTWQPLESGPVSDTYYAVDMVKRLFAKEIDLYYRVKLDTGLHQKVSDPVRADGGMPKRDWLIARQIIRKEYLHMIKGPSGVKGCLLKRRNWGDRCEACTDYDTGLPSQDCCPTCYSTGIVGGYYPAVDYWMLLSGHGKQTSRNTSSGHTSQVTVTARCVAFPMLSPGDIWCSSEDGRRYVIGEGSRGINVISKVRDKPIVLQANMALAPASSTIYDVPLESCILNRSYSVQDAAPCEEKSEPEVVVVEETENEPDNEPVCGSGIFVPDY